IIMPPPNANGSLHAGHAVFVTIEDLIIRYKRMMGFKTLWLPGADHAGFETQVVYEKKLEKEGRSRFGMDPETLRKEILDFTLLNKEFMENQLRALGASCDWSREKFTLDTDIIKTVYDTFEKLYEDDLVYRGKRTVNWCPKHQTSLSELETENIEEQTPFYYFKYGPFTIGTVRPETKFGDKYIVMHPDDARYREYKEGQKFEVEWINGPILATIIKDESVDPTFGSGVMTITPWHSQVDFEIAKRHNLDYEQIIDWRAKLLHIGGEFAGMKITDARPKITEKLKSKGLLVSIDEHYKNVVKRCYKCNSAIEPQVKNQWFLKMAPLATPVIEKIRKNEILFYPEHYKKIMLHWLENIEDWNISRQIVWGIPIPVWYHEPRCVPKLGRDEDVAKCIDTVVSIDKPSCEFCDAEFIRDPDTFDTWFSSGQWPFATLGFPNGKDFKKFYPTQVMETAGEIIFFWVARMLMMGLYRTGALPFKTVYLHGIVTARDGKKMSKSRGNIISPLELTKKYGTDALRMALIIGNTPGTSTALYEEKIKAYKLFANKLWNVARFVLTAVDGVEFGTSVELREKDRVTLNELTNIAKDITSDIEQYRFYVAGEKIYHYIWHTLADKILEESKPRLAGSDAAKKYSAQVTLFKLLEKSLVLLHPFMPFITEEIWQSLPVRKQPLIVTSYDY
ncbi:MAG: valine--tRNA ligase, partial [Patescibacteria group bacterium]